MPIANEPSFLTNPRTRVLQVWEHGRLLRSISLRFNTTFTISGDGDGSEGFLVAHGSVSSPHATLIASSRALFLQDRGSAHGTWVDEEGSTDGGRRGRRLAAETGAEAGAQSKLFQLRPDVTTFRVGEALVVFRIASREAEIKSSDSRTGAASLETDACCGTTYSPVRSDDGELTGGGDDGVSSAPGVLWQGSVSTFSNSLGAFRRLGEFSSSDMGAWTADLPEALELRFCARASVGEGLKPLVLSAGASAGARQLSELRKFLEAGDKVCHTRTAAGRDVFVVGLREPSGQEPWRLDCRFSKPIDRDRPRSSSKHDSKRLRVEHTEGEAAP